jgi:DNA-binding MarR family transcriptional regulator
MTGDERIAAQIERLFALLIREGGRLGKEDEPGLTLRQGFALAAIADEGPQRLGALADRLGTTDATASRTVDALLALGLVERSEDPVDRRAVRIAASPAGRKLVAQRRRHLTQLLERPLAGIAQTEQAHIATVLADLNSLLA